MGGSEGGTGPNVGGNVTAYACFAGLLLNQEYGYFIVINYNRRIRYIIFILCTTGLIAVYNTMQ